MKVAVFTSGRQDWGILAPVCQAIQAAPGLDLQVMAGGMHWRAGQQGHLDGIPVVAWIVGMPAGDDDGAVALAAAETAGALARELAAHGSEALLVVGDRTETLAAGMVATCLRLPLVHLHGGETTRGAVDDSCRHALSMLARVHAVAHRDFARRLLSWGIPAAHVIESGAPALDVLLSTGLPSRAELESHLGRTMGEPLVLLTHHPATLGVDPAIEAGAVIAGVDAALADAPMAQVIASRANADAGGGIINAALDLQAARDSRWQIVTALGSRRWWGLMSWADALVGNSSSAILEAPCFDLPAINVGDRQDGRLRLNNIVDVQPQAEVIAAALTAAFGQTHPRPRRPHATAYGSGQASLRIVAALVALAAIPPSNRLSRKILS